MTTSQTNIAASQEPLNNDKVHMLRHDFPIFENKNGQRKSTHDNFIYLDSAATSQKPESVIVNQDNFYRNYNAAVHRGTSELGSEVTERFEGVREKVAGFIGARPDEVIWTSGATEGINLLSYALSQPSEISVKNNADEFVLKPGDEILITEMEHHSNLVPWQQAALRTGATLKYVPIDDQKGLDLEQVSELITEKTKIVSVVHVSNVLGNINPIKKISEMAKKVGAIMIADACQSVPHMKVDVKDLGVDFLVFSGHKMLAPYGVGVLYGRRELLEKTPVFLTGGSMITTVTMEQSQFLKPPMKFEAGTQPVAEVLGLGQAIDYLEKIGLENIQDWEKKIGLRLVKGLSTIEDLKILGPGVESERVGLVSFDIQGIHAHDLGQYIDSQGIVVRVGHHCAQPLHRHYGIASSVRASSYLYTTTEDIDRFLEVVSDGKKYFRKLGMET